MNQHQLNKLLIAKRRYDAIYEDCDNEISKVIKQLIKKYAEAFNEVHKADPNIIDKRYNYEYRWIFCSDYIETVVEGDSVMAYTFERGRCGDSDEQRYSFYITVNHFNEEYQNQLVEQWKTKERDKAVKVKEKKTLDKQAQISKLEEQLKTLRGE